MSTHIVLVTFTYVFVVVSWKDTLAILLCMHNSLCVLFQYQKMPMQYTNIQIFLEEKYKFHKKKDILLIFTQNKYCVHTLDAPRRGGSNEYPQSMFWSKNKKKKIYTPANHCCTV